MTLYQFSERVFQWWNFITLINIYHFDGNKVKIKVHDESYPFIEISLWWKLNVDEIHQFDENLSLWWNVITAIENQCYDKKHW